MDLTCHFAHQIISESESLHEDVRQGRLSDDHREADREENNPPSNGVLNSLIFFCIGCMCLPNYYVSQLISFYLLFLLAVLILKGLDALSTEASVSLLCFLSGLHLILCVTLTHIFVVH